MNADVEKELQQIEGWIRQHQDGLARSNLSHATKGTVDAWYAQARAATDDLTFADASNGLQELLERLRAKGLARYHNEWNGRDVRTTIRFPFDASW